jgi:hypothetical protein
LVDAASSVLRITLIENGSWASLESVVSGFTEQRSA